MRRSVMRRFPILAVIATLFPTVSFGQSNPSEGLDLLTQVSKKYADAKSYYVESTKEKSSSGEFSRIWRKTLLIAAEAPGGSYHYEGKFDFGSAMRIADGQTVWTYQENDHRYTAKPEVPDDSNAPKIIRISENALFEAEHLRKQLSTMADSLKSAELLPDATLRLEGHDVVCNVVRVRSSDQKRPPARRSFEKTIWIEKKNQVVLKISDQEQTYMSVPGGGDVPISEEITTLYTNTTLDAPPRDDLFHFVPLPSAKLVAEFPDPAQVGSSLTGEQLPSLKLKSSDGKVVAVESFQGKPVLIDVWATWCAPCVSGMPKLAKLYDETKNKGLVFLSVDLDEEASTGTDFLNKRGYGWANFHDEGEVEKLIGPAGVPRVLLMDDHGRVLYDGRADEDKLRMEIAKLGPQYASLRTSPQQAPCATPK